MGDMDSGNSGSMQSSSTGGGGGGGGGGGDDQEYDSRGGGNESISAFYNPMSTFNLDNMGVAAASPPLQLYSFSNVSSSFAHHNHHQVVSNYFDNPTTTLDQCPNFMLNNHHSNNDTNNNNNNDNQLDMVWRPNKFATTAASIRPPPISTNDANCTTDGPLGYTITNNQQQQAPPRPTSLPSPLSAPPTPPVASSGTITSITGPGVRNPKKRSRASRRAPTTVLSTDTSNFRQMVQEFTGIPAPPFTGFSTRARFDLFNGLGLGLGSGPGSGHSNPSVPSPSYLLRPLPQKMPPLHQPPFSANSSLPSHTTTNTTGIITNNTTSTSMNMTATVAPESTTFNLCDPDQNFMNTNSSQQLSCLSSTPATLPHQNSCSVNPASGTYRGISTNTAASAAANGALDNIGGATKGEGMVDSWICSSSD